MSGSLVSFGHAETHPAVQILRRLRDLPASEIPRYLGEILSSAGRNAGGRGAAARPWNAPVSNPDLNSLLTQIKPLGGA